MEEENRGKIDRLNDRLYSRTRYRDPLNKRTPIKKLDSSDVEGKWQTPDLDEMLKREYVAQKINPFIKKVFISALLFFVAAIAVAGYVFMGGANFVSSKNVDINVLGPTTVAAGETLELDISISNKNNADLEFTNLTIQYPQGSRNPNNTAEALTYTSDNLGMIQAGAETIRNIPLVLLGSLGETREIKFSVEYKVKGSNATFYKDKIFEITIGETPITITIDSPSTTISGDSFTTVVSIAMKSSNVLKNVVLKVEYPYGYSVLDTVPETVSDKNIWFIGDLSPGDKKTISIKGQLIGEDKEERTFRFYVGVSDGNTFSQNLKINVISTLNTIAIERRSIDLDISLNGDRSPIYVTSAARPITATIKYKNNFIDKILAPRLEVDLSSLALDKFSVFVSDGGIYDSVNSKAFWNITNSRGNSELAPGEGGQVTLRFSSLPSQSLSEVGRDISLKFSINGVPVGAVGQRPIVVNESRIVKISSQVNLSSKILHSLGSFVNYGPIPPKADEETTYTVVLSVGNIQGDLTDAKMVMNLGQNVAWKGASSFTNDNISYDSPSNTVTWNLEKLSIDTSFSSAVREASFQISLTPSISQIGTIPTLITGVVFSARDTITGNIITATNPPLTTRLNSDPAFIQGDDIVVK